MSSKCSSEDESVHSLDLTKTEKEEVAETNGTSELVPPTPSKKSPNSDLGNKENVDYVKDRPANTQLGCSETELNNGKKQCVQTDDLCGVNNDTEADNSRQRIYPNLDPMKGGDDSSLKEISSSVESVPPQRSTQILRQDSVDSDSDLPNSGLKVKIGGSDEDLEDRSDPRVEVLPPDGGWGWVVVAASFMCNVMVDGIIFTAGMLLPFIMVEFEASYAQVSWVTSLLGGFYLLAGPFVSSLASAYGFRTVCIIGSIGASVASGISYFANSLAFLYISYGVLAGIGFGFIYVPAVIATGFYFEKKRALATGIAVCGSGIGAFVIAPVNKYLLGSVGWRGVLLVNACLILTCIIYSLAFRPLSAATGRVVAIDEEYPGAIPLMTRISDTRDGQMEACLSTVSLPPDPNHPDVAADRFHKPLLHPQVMRLIRDETGQAIGHHSHSTGRLAAQTSHRGSRGSIHSVHSKPFFRDDIFYAGSMARLPQYNSSESMGEYRASVTHMPDAALDEEHAAEETGGCCKRCPTASKAFLAKTFDFSLCTSPTFQVLASSGFLSLMSLFIPYAFLPAFINQRWEEFGFKDEEEAEQSSTFLMSLIGICNTIGRVICGWVADRPKVDAILVNNLALIIGGAVTILLPFITNVSLLYGYGIVFGLSVAVFASLRSILLVELLGLEKLTSSFGLLLLIQGVAACLGSPIAGGFVDLTKSFDVSFYVFGLTYAISGAMCIPIRKIKRWEDTRIEKKLQQEVNKF